MGTDDYLVVIVHTRILAMHLSGMVNLRRRVHYLKSPVPSRGEGKPAFKLGRGTAGCPGMPLVYLFACLADFFPLGCSARPVNSNRKRLGCVWRGLPHLRRVSAKVKVNRS